MASYGPYGPPPPIYSGPGMYGPPPPPGYGTYPQHYPAPQPQPTEQHKPNANANANNNNNNNHNNKAAGNNNNHQNNNNNNNNNHANSKGGETKGEQKDVVPGNAFSAYPGYPAGAVPGFYGVPAGPYGGPAWRPEDPLITPGPISTRVMPWEREQRERERGRPLSPYSMHAEREFGGRMDPHGAGMAHLPPPPPPSASYGSRYEYPLPRYTDPLITDPRYDPLASDLRYDPYLAARSRSAYRPGREYEAPVDRYRELDPRYEPEYHANERPRSRGGRSAAGAGDPYDDLYGGRSRPFASRPVRTPSLLYDLTELDDRHNYLSQRAARSLSRPIEDDLEPVIERSWRQSRSSLRERSRWSPRSYERDRGTWDSRSLASAPASRPAPSSSHDHADHKDKDHKDKDHKSSSSSKAKDDHKSSSSSKAKDDHKSSSSKAKSSSSSSKKH
jgi:hypothetical protein